VMLRGIEDSLREREGVPLLSAARSQTLARRQRC
jgi:hypothetical protein